MGYNSLLFVLNDRLSDINRDPKTFWENGQEAHRAAMNCKPDREKTERQLEARRFAHQSEWVWNGHADQVGIVAVGYNTPVVLGSAYCVGDFTKEAGQVEILKQLADSLGYKLIKKPNKKG
jgi:hypothetical protein